MIPSNPFFEVRLEKLFDLAEKADRAFRQAGLEYRVAGGLATYLYVERAAPDAGRLTRDIDIAVRRADSPGPGSSTEPRLSRAPRRRPPPR